MPPKKRELHDKFFLQAKAEGYAARSAYKLQEIQERHHLLRPGMRILDLGCAPGSWLQVAAKRVKLRGTVVGIDLTPVTLDLPENVRTVTGDVFKITAEDMVDMLGGPADVVLSDMAPNTTGDPSGDHYRSVALCRRVLELLPTVLDPGGSLAMKVFEGGEYPQLLEDTSRHFGFVKGLKPEATREVSREMFIIGHRYKGPLEVKPVTVKPKDKHKVAPKRPTPGSGWGRATPSSPRGKA
ncbi:MAG: RlmE family RNA methyltransferase [Phycisphaerales bacterium]